MNSAAILPALVFLVSLIPFASVHAPERLALGFVAAVAGSAALLRKGDPLGKTGSRLLLVAVAAWLWEAVAFLPVGDADRARLQPGLAAAIGDALAIAGNPSHPLAISPWLALVAWTLTGGLVLLAVGTARLVRDEASARGLALGLVLCGVAVVATASLHRVIDAPSIYWSSGVPAFQRDPFFAPFVSPNHGGAACAALLPLAAALALSGSPLRRVGAGLGASVLAGGVWMSGSRAAWIDAAAGLAVLAFLVGNRALRMVLVAGLGVAMGVLVVVGPEQVLLWLTASVTPEQFESIELGYGDVLSGRGDLYRDVLRLVAAAPWVGVGPGSFGDAYGLVKTTPDFSHMSHAHQEGLQTLAEHGAIGLALWVAVWAGLTWSSHRTRPTEHESRKRHLWAGLLAGLVALGVDSLVDFPLRIGALAVLAAIFVGAVVGLGVANDGACSSRLGRVRGFGLGALIGGVALAATVAALLRTSTGENAWGPPEPLLAQGDALVAEAAAIPPRQARQQRADDVTAMLNDAAVAYRRALHRVPTSWRALSALALLQRAQGQTDEAARTLAVATAVYPTLPWPWRDRARVARLVEDEEGAADAWRHMLASNLPKDATPYVREAMGTGQDPLIIARAVLPERADRWVTAGRIQERIQQNRAAEALYREAMRINPRAAVELAGALVRWGRVDEAALLLQPLPQTCRGTLVSGEIALARQQGAEAERVYTEAMRVCGTHERKARVGIARARLAQADMRALVILRALVDEDPSDTSTMRMLIRELDGLGHTEEAAVYREKLVNAKAPVETPEEEEEAGPEGEEGP